MITGAKFSKCKNYRYALWRVWNMPENEKPKMLAFIMLNPSTADEVKNDPTVERCQRRCKAWGFDGLFVANIFAYRSTDPAALYDIKDPVGPQNDKHILNIASLSKQIICGWGNHGNLHSRGREVCNNLRKAGYLPYALVINKDGNPKHPLYVGYNQNPIVLPAY